MDYETCLTDLFYTLGFEEGFEPTDQSDIRDTLTSFLSALETIGLTAEAQDELNDRIADWMNEHREEVDFRNLSRSINTAVYCAGAEMLNEKVPELEFFGEGGGFRFAERDNDSVLYQHEDFLTVYDSLVSEPALKQEYTKKSHAEMELD